MCNLNFNTFLKLFNEQYDYLYENNDNVAGFDEALTDFDKFVAKQPNFVGKFVKLRGDFISSDREVVAFMFALEIMLGFRKVS